MIRNTVIALSAIAAMGIALAPAAQAKNNIDINFGFGFGGHGHHGHHGGIYIYGDDDYCHYKKFKVVKWNKWHTKKIVFFKKKLVCY